MAAVRRQEEVCREVRCNRQPVAQAWRAVGVRHRPKPTL